MNTWVKDNQAVVQSPSGEICQPILLAIQGFCGPVFGRLADELWLKIRGLLLDGTG